MYSVCLKMRYTRQIAIFVDDIPMDVGYPISKQNPWRSNSPR